MVTEYEDFRGSFRGSMSQRRTRTLRADGMHQITVASLFGKRQGCFQTIPLQHFAEFSLSEHNEPWARYFYESNTDLDGLLAAAEALHLTFID